MLLELLALPDFAYTRVNYPVDIRLLHWLNFV